MRFVFDTSVLIDYLRNPNDIAADALFIAAERGEAFVSLISLMELYLPQNKSNVEIENEVTAIQKLCTRLGIKFIPSSPSSQQRALAILERYRSPLGRSALPDSLILGVGMARRAYLVTKDKHWFEISDKSVKLVSPEELVQRF